MITIMDKLSLFYTLKIIWKKKMIGYTQNMITSDYSLSYNLNHKIIVYDTLSIYLSLKVQMIIIMDKVSLFYTLKIIWKKKW